MAFSGSSPVCGIAVSSRRAAIHWTITYSSASSIAAARQLFFLLFGAVLPTVMFRYPHIPCHFIMRGRWERLDVLSLGVLVCVLRPWERSFEHARCAHEAVVAPPLY